MIFKKSSLGLCLTGLGLEKLGGLGLATSLHETKVTISLVSQQPPASATTNDQLFCL